jgi:hypothetical protein
MCRVSHSGNSGPDLWAPSSQIASFRGFARNPDADKADGFRGSSEYPSSVCCVAKVSIFPFRDKAEPPGSVAELRGASYKQRWYRLFDAYNIRPDPVSQGAGEIDVRFGEVS